MKLAFINLPAHGHINPTLPLVAELTSRGHEVTYFATREFAERCERQGAQFRCYPSLPYDHTKPDTNLLALAAALLDLSAQILPWMLEQIRSEPFDAVLYDSMCPWGRFAARLAQLPTICSTSTFAMDPALFVGVRQRFGMLRTLVGGAPALLRARRSGRELERRWGVTGTSLHEIFTNRGDLTLVYTSRSFQPRADLFDERVRFVGPSMPAGSEPDPLLDELDSRSASDPLIYVSLGTLQNERPEFYAACIEAFRKRKVRLVVSVGHRIDPRRFGATPNHIWIRRSAPQLGVLDRAAVFVSHGGMNSVSESLVRGVPLLIWPQQDEQALVARRVVSVGAGRLMQAWPGARAIARGVETLLEDPSYAAAAQKLGASLTEAGGARAAADQIEAFLADA